jgi:hypothetical protein
MKTSIFFVFLMIIVIIGCRQPKPVDDLWNYAISRKSDLQLSAYFTAHTLEQAMATDEGRRETVSLLRCNGITKTYIEVYRSGLVVPPEKLKNYLQFLKKNGFEIVGGIATVPGKDFGIPQEGPLTWFNWQNPKTQSDLRKVIEDSAPLFDTFIIDDFLCTADTSYESKTAKGDRSWSEYRRSLLTGIAESVFLKPAKTRNPSLKMIIKYPQWYDRFHLFGYDLSTEPALFDQVWVGTESRGQYTQRYGFVQPYEGFINYRWIASVAGQKIGGAWFDHGDCTDLDFIEQAYQSVLAGAKELVIFNFDSFLTGHPGHHLLRQDFGKLADLAVAVSSNPVKGTVGYKPVNSDAGGDLYLMDYIGMLGVSLVPESNYPENANVVFLPTHAAADPAITEKVLKSLKEGRKLILTTGFIARAKGGEKLAQLAGITYPLEANAGSTFTILNNGKADSIKFPMVTDYRIVPEGAITMLETTGRNGSPFLVTNKDMTISVINTHTFSQNDFDAVGEVLLCPRQIGLLELPRSWINTIRLVFQDKSLPEMNAPSRVAMQCLSDDSFVIHNYNQNKTNLEIHLPGNEIWVDGFMGQRFQVDGETLRMEMQPRSRFWVKQQLSRTEQDRITR